MNYRALLLISILALQPIASHVYAAEKVLQAKGYPEDLASIILPANSPLAPTLAQIFASPHVLKNNSYFSQAGFQTLFLRSRGNLRIAKHPLLPGYLFKLYLEDEIGSGFARRQKLLITRAIVAAKVRDIVRAHHLTRIDVADKWLFQVPDSALTKKKTYVLVVKDMQLTSRAESANAWKSKITKAHLKELYEILRRGYTSLALIVNIPYAKTGKFSCIDTEFEQRDFRLERVKKVLSKKNQKAWGKIIKTKRLGRSRR